MLAVGIIVGILIMAIIYCISMYAYFLARQKYSESKYSIEIIAVVLAILFSVSVKLVINLLTVEENAKPALLSKQDFIPISYPLPLTYTVPITA